METINPLPKGFTIFLIDYLTTLFEDKYGNLNLYPDRPKTFREANELAIGLAFGPPFMPLVCEASAGRDNLVTMTKELRKKREHELRLYWRECGNGWAEEKKERNNYGGKY